MFTRLSVCVSSSVQGDSQTSVCITIEPGLLLKGDILVSTISSSLSDMEKYDMYST